VHQPFAEGLTGCEAIAKAGLIRLTTHDDRVYTVEFFMSACR